MSAMEISCNYGVYEKRFENVFNKFNTNLASSIDIGASFAVYSSGKLLVDLAGGFKNKDKTELWTPTTTVCVHSTGKGIVAMCLAILIEKGMLNLDNKVSEYWLEFGANNKTDITVRTLLSHQAGLYAWKEKMTESDFLNWNY